MSHIPFVIKLLFSFLFFIITYLGYGQDIHDILSTIPENDKKALLSLFHNLVNDHFAYTLFADKPVSLSGDFTITPMNNILRGFRCGGRFWNEWAIWNKYKHKFKLNNYILIDEPSGVLKNNSLVILINKKAFIKTIKKHKKLFDKILRRDIQAENLLKDIESKRVSFQNSIKNSQLLWGILLGYGEHNATLYAERDEYLDLKKKIILPLSITQVEKVDEKIHSLNQQLQPFGEDRYFPLVSGSVFFVADPEHPETKALENKYRKLRGKISAIYAQGDFLEITLSKLTSN